MTINGATLSVKSQCSILGISTSTYYYNVNHRDEIEKKKAENLQIEDERAHIVNAEWSEYPAMGYRKCSLALLDKGYSWATERVVRRIFEILGIKGIMPVFKTTRPSKHPYGKYPYLLKNKIIRYPNQVWATDITYIRVDEGMLYFTAVIDLYSRKILSWRLSDNMETGFCIDAVNEAIQNYGVPAIFNTDQGSQYTSKEFISLLESYGIEISMDGRDRYADNIIVERTWRTLKYEWVFLKDYKTKDELEAGLGAFVEYFNGKRLHEGLGYQIPNEVYEAGCFPNINIDIEEQVELEEITA